MRRLLPVLLVASPAAGCTAGVLAPASPEARLIADLGWFMFVVAGLVMALVLALMAWALLRRRREEPAGWTGTKLVVAGGIVLPLLVLPVVWFLSLPAMAEISGPDEPVALEVEVTGHRWYYEVRYPASGVVVRDELHLPLDERVLIRVSSADVIHSFWVPELGGKRDMVPGLVNELSVRPARAAVYGARCAEYCGIGHAAMTMRVVIEPRAELDAWLRSRSAGAQAEHRTGEDRR